jgi:PAS domain S-box-containing protein
MSLDEVHGLRKKIDELIQQLQLTESWLEGNENRMRTVITAIPVGLLISNDSGLIEALNPQCLKLFRCDYSDLDRRRIADLFQAALGDLFKDLNSSAQSQEIRALRPNGESFPAEIILRPFQTPHGQKVVVVVEDVTRRHEIEQILNLAKEKVEKSEKRLMTMIANMPVGLAIVSQDGTIEFSNPAMQKIFGKHDLFGEQLQEVLSIKNKQLTDILINKQTVVCEPSQALGKPIAVEVSATEITMLDQEKFLIILQDITSRVQLQRLRQEFVAMVTHDLRSPLTSIDISLYLIEEVLGKMDTSVPTVVMSHVENTRRSSNRLLRLVNDLLDYEKLESGSFSLSFGKTSVAAIVEQSLSEVQPIAEKRRIKIEAPPQTIELEADESRIVQVMVNLLSNAVKFSEENSVVTIAAFERNGEIEIQIIDGGRGIPNNLKQVVFEKYKQIRSDDGRRGKGTGLGLPICKALIEGHDGEIGVIDSPQQGSTFWFRLPQRRPK